MKNTLFVCSLVVLMCSMIAMVNAFDINAKQLVNPQSCRRRIQTNFEDSSKTIIFSSKAGCVDRTNSTTIATFGELLFLASVKRFPVIGMTGKTTLKINAPGDRFDRDFAVEVGSAFGFDRIIEFVENNNVPGFQPGNDTTVKTYLLAGQSWKVVDLKRTQLNDANTSILYQAVTEAVVTGCCTVRLSAMVATEEVSFTSSKFVNRTGVVQVLTPSSFKVSLEISGITYTNANSLFALSTLVAFRGKIFEKPPVQMGRSLLSGEEQEKPEDANADQSVNEFDSDVSSQLGGAAATLPKPFFSFQNFISRYPTSSPTTVTRATIIRSPMIPVNSLTNDENDLRGHVNNGVLARFIVSLQDRVENFVWDPTVGNQDLQTISGASSTRNTMYGMCILLLSVIAFLL